MTSKEALKDLRHRIQALFITMPNVYDDTKIIEKDLEVLQILKNNFCNFEQWADYKGIIERTTILFDIPTSELQKIKEWLNEK